MKITAHNWRQPLTTTKTNLPLASYVSSILLRGREPAKVACENEVPKNVWNHTIRTQQTFLPLSALLETYRVPSTLAHNRSRDHFRVFVCMDLLKPNQTMLPFLQNQNILIFSPIHAMPSVSPTPSARDTIEQSRSMLPSCVHANTGWVNCLLPIHVIISGSQNFEIREQQKRHETGVKQLNFG